MRKITFLCLISGFCDNIWVWSFELAHLCFIGEFPYRINQGSVFNTQAWMSIPTIQETKAWLYNHGIKENRKALPRSSRVTKSGEGGRETGDGSGSESQSWEESHTPGRLFYKRCKRNGCKQHLELETSFTLLTQRAGRRKAEEQTQHLLRAV